MPPPVAPGTVAGHGWVDPEHGTRTRPLAVPNVPDDPARSSPPSATARSAVTGSSPRAVPPTSAASAARCAAILTATTRLTTVHHVGRPLVGCGGLR